MGKTRLSKRGSLLVMGNKDTFIRITNKDIYDRLELFEKNNSKSHNLLMNHQLRTNGKVKLNRWIASTALTLWAVTLPIIISAIIRFTK